MRIFISAGEPSGDLHGANLAAALSALRPRAACEGFGGTRMEAAGCRLLYPLSRLAVMGILPVLGQAPLFLSLLSRADRHFRHRRPDAVVLIDFPGFNWWVARRAHFHGIPVFYFIPPQLWAWAGWRVSKIRRWVDHVLCPLPFEEQWYASRGVAARYVGHPYFDELAGQRLDARFLAEERRRPGPVVGLLPGSRTHEVEDNLSTLARAALRIHAQRPDARFLVACYRRAHRDFIQARLARHGLPIEVHVGRTAEIIELSHACVAVSGSVGLELLYRGRPSVVVYRAKRHLMALGRVLLKAKYISLVNLIADRELFPEFLSTRCEAQAVAGHVLGWLNDAGRYDRACRELAELRSRVAERGACTRAAEYILRALEERPEKPSSLPRTGAA